MNNITKALITVLFLISIPLASAELEAYIVESGPEEVNDMIYTWGSADTTAYYQDAQSYPDVGLMICDSSGDLNEEFYAGVAYEVDGERQLVSYGDDSNLEPADNAVTYNGGLCQMTSIGGLTVSPSEISGTPETKIAAFPAEVNALLAEDVEGSNSQIVETNSQLSGSYSGSISYDYDTNRLDLEVDSITVDSDVGLESFNPDTAGRGVTSSRPMIIGACSHSSGDSCNGLVEKKTNADFPINFGFDIDTGEVNDQNVYTRYGIANGKLFDSVDIGADIDITGLSVSRNPVYYSQNQTASFSVINRGNVPVTTDFSVSASIEDDGETVDSRQFSVTEGLEIGESKSFSYQWEAFEESGVYTVDVEADTGNDVAEISEFSSSSRSFDLEAITFPEVYVNGIEKDDSDVEFENAGVPYNLTLVMKDSDNTTLDGTDVVLIEEDGMSTLVPQQSLENSFTDMRKSSRFTTDSDGEASLTVIPSGNVLLSDRYNDTDIQESIDYSVYMTASRNGEDLTFISDGETTRQYPFEVDNPGSLEGEDTQDLPNLDNRVKAVMNGVYTIFAEFWGAIT